MDFPTRTYYLDDGEIALIRESLDHHARALTWRKKNGPTKHLEIEVDLTYKVLENVENQLKYNRSVEKDQ